MTSLQLLTHGFTQIINTITDKSAFALGNLSQRFQKIDPDTLQVPADQIQIEQDISEKQVAQKNVPEPQKPQQQQFQGLDQLELIQSRAVGNSNVESGVKKRLTPDLQSQERKKKRVKEIEEEKKRIAEELRQLDDEIDQIKGKNVTDNVFKKYEKIHRDEAAQKQAEQLVKELKSKRKQIQLRKKQDFEKSLLEIKKEDEERRKLREEELLRAKEERRLQILQRMEEDKKRREERKMIEAQSNQLIAKLKKEEQLEKITAMAPSHLMEVDQRKKTLQKKNNFNLEEIQEHDRKYRKLKQANRREKQERALSLKVNRQANSHKFAKNVWIERIEEEEQRKREEEKFVEERKKIQLEKRMKYGELVKNIFLPKKKERDTENLNDKKLEGDDYVEDRQKRMRGSEKPRTPDIPSLPKVKTGTKNRTQNQRMFREESLPSIKQSKNGLSEQKQIKQRDQEEEEKQRLRKIRENQLRKQTKQRLKKIQSQSLNKPVSQDERVKYKNYLGDVKVRKDDVNDWKRIIKNDKLTEEEKYQEIIKKAGDLQAKARKREDLPNHQAEEDVVNLYIGSIQAKLALLEKF